MTAPLAKGQPQSDTSKHQAVKHKMTITEVLTKHTGKWMEIPGVVGTAEGRKDGKPCINIMVAKRTKVVKQRIPKKVDGYEVVIQETGEFEAR